jgi:hypothetical protein
MGWTKNIGFISSKEKLSSSLTECGRFRESPLSVAYNRR